MIKKAKDPTVISIMEPVSRNLSERILISFDENFELIAIEGEMKQI
jgi:hypothetical protein